jgi:GMP synthase (glutamine-hydrolysing)
MYPHQVFRVGDVAWGLQFHPEVSLADYRNWTAREPGNEAAAESFDRREREVTAAARTLARRFAGLCRERR